MTGEMMVWLAAELDRREQTARDAQGAWEGVADGWRIRIADEQGRTVAHLPIRLGAEGTPEDPGGDYATATHIETHDPQAVLRRVAADRKTLELHDRPHECSIYRGDDIDTCAWVMEGEVCDTVRLIAEGYGWTGVEDSGRHVPASGLRLSSSDPQPPTGTVVVDDCGTTWINTGDYPCPWVPYRRDGDPESWTKIAGNYGPVTVQRRGTA